MALLWSVFTRLLTQHRPFPKGFTSPGPATSVVPVLNVHLQTDLGLPFVARVCHCVSFLVGNMSAMIPEWPMDISGVAGPQGKVRSCELEGA